MTRLRQFRPACKLSKSVSQHLNMYALAAGAAGVAALALAQPSEAKIVYTPAHRKLPLNKDYVLDLNHDGTKDFRFHIYTSDDNRRRGTAGTRDSAFLWIYPQVKGNQIVGKSPYASALRAGITIGPKRTFNNGRGSMGGVDFFSGGGPVYDGPWANSGKAVDDRYLGLEFAINGKIHFGWARLNVRIYRNPEATVHAVLTGYAYETIPGKPIVTGATNGPDDAEPTASFNPLPPNAATLGMLALGAPAVSIWRREESVVAAPEGN
jgi:hypothetical protein